MNAKEARELSANAPLRVWETDTVTKLEERTKRAAGTGETQINVKRGDMTPAIHRHFEKNGFTVIELKTKFKIDWAEEI